MKPNEIFDEIAKGKIKFNTEFIKVGEVILKGNNHERKMKKEQIDYTYTNEYYRMKEEIIRLKQIVKDLKKELKNYKEDANSYIYEQNELRDY